MVFPSVCCENHWLIKKLAWSDRVEQSQVGKTKLNAGKKKVESERSYRTTTRDIHVKSLPVSHSHMLIHRLKEMG